MKLTYLTLTDEQIEAMRIEAGEIGDLAAVAICWRALGHKLDRHNVDGPFLGNTEDYTRALRMTTRTARLEVARWINEARAQVDDDQVAHDYARGRR